MDRRRPQKVAQLVEVPTVMSFSTLLQTAEQTIDIPVPRTGGDHGGLQGFFSQNRILQRRSPSSLLTFQFPVVPFTILILGRQPHPQFRVVRLLKVFFRTFPRSQKSAQSAGSLSARVHAHSSSWTPAAYEAE